MDSLRITNIIFDFAGVIVECPHEAFINKVFPQLHDQTKLKQVSDLIFKSKIWSEYDKGLAYSELKPKLCGLIQAQSELSSCNGTDIDALIDVMKSMMVPMQDSVKLIKQLKSAGITLYGLTNMPKEIYNHLIKTHHVFSYLSGVVTSAYTGLAKPDMPIYERVLNDYKLTAENSIFLDDRQENLTKAKELGMKTVLFSSAQQVTDILIDEFCLKI